MWNLFIWNCQGTSKVTKQSCWLFTWSILHTQNAVKDFLLGIYVVNLVKEFWGLKGFFRQEPEIQNAGLEVLQVLTTKQGPLMSSYYESLTSILVTLLQTGKAAAKKRAIQCLGPFFAKASMGSRSWHWYYLYLMSVFHRLCTRSRQFSLGCQFLIIWGATNAYFLKQIHFPLLLWQNSSYHER